jgi:hypothetical protein
MHSLALVFALLVQDDPFKTLSDPARRADAGARQAACEAFRARAGESAVHAAAARFLEKSDREWRLVFDRIKTPNGTVAGTLDGANFVPFSGQKIPAGSGAVEKDVRDAAGTELNAFLAKFWAAAPADAQHRDALTALAAASEKAAKSEAGPDLFRLFAMAHLAALGDKGADLAGKFGLSKEDNRWGRKDELALWAIAKGFAKPAYVPAEAEKSALGSPAFAPRYVATLVQIAKVFSANTGFESTWKPLAKLSGAGAPKGTPDHMKALADGLKAAAACGNCKAGKVTCEVCDGKKKADFKCPKCKGLGWAQKGEEANRLIKCTNCQGGCVFKNHPCTGCKATGQIECAVCGAGKGWRESFKGCKDCKTCATCKGRRETVTPCAKCKGKGRVPPEVMGIPTILCDDCKGAADIKENCKACGATGIGDCATCGGKEGKRDGKSGPKVEDVFTTESCGACAGKGWPWAGMAIPCDKCYGLGVRIKPTVDGSKMLGE